MSTKDDTGRPQRQRIEDEPAPTPWWRYATASGLVVAVLGAGLVLGFGDFFDRPDAETADALPVQMSMAGFDPGIIMAKAGEELAIELWTTDAALHLHNGIHTLISDELGIYEELAAESRRTVTLRMPMTPGDYDIYCDTCCGGKASPTMHGILRVEA
ncbi:MAG: cupredoxin domain-containing protein [Candidatus Limnocylindrales bacterium]